MARLTTHVLDTARGKPGAGVTIKLFSLEGGRHLVATSVTNVDGRTDEPLMGTDTWRAGTYDIEFLIGDYFADSDVPAGEPPFLNEIVVRVTLGEGRDYHVPLLVSPWSYTTYRGS